MLFNPLPENRDKGDYSWVTPELEKSAKISSYASTYFFLDFLSGGVTGKKFSDYVSSWWNKSRKNT